MNTLFTAANTARHARNIDVSSRSRQETVLWPFSAIVRHLVDALRSARARREMHGLDANALRDLGISRSELDSYWAESHGLAEQTRTRVIRDMRGRSAP